MNTSVTLAQLPYTGFDYGQMYNSLYWVGILVWSLIIALIIIKNKQRIARIFAGLAKVFIVEKRQRAPVQSQEPQILQERVVKFDPLVDPIASIGMSKAVGAQGAQQDDLLRAIDSITKVTNGNNEIDDTAKQVKNLVQKELAVSRVGQTPDEFSNDDFGTVDFDGVNPDDSWVQKSEKVSLPTANTVHMQAPRHDAAKPVESSKKYDLSEHITTHVEDSIPQEEPTSESLRAVTDPKNDKVFADSIALDTSSEYPKIVLTREEVSNY